MRQGGGTRDPQFRADREFARPGALVSYRGLDKFLRLLPPLTLGMQGEIHEVAL